MRARRYRVGDTLRNGKERYSLDLLCHCREDLNFRSVQNPYPLIHSGVSLHIPISGYAPCMFSDEAIDKFIAIYEEKYQEPISRADAVAMAMRLVDLYKVLRQPIPLEKMQEFLEIDFPFETLE